MPCIVHSLGSSHITNECQENQNTVNSELVIKELGFTAKFEDGFAVSLGERIFVAEVRLMVDGMWNTLRTKILTLQVVITRAPQDVIRQRLYR